MSVGLLLQPAVDFAGLVDAVVPALGLVALEDEGGDDHAEIVQVHTMENIFLFLQFHNQAICHEKRANHLGGEGGRGLNIEYHPDWVVNHTS